MENEHFQINELQHGGDSEEEQIRLRKIFETLKERAIQNEYLSEHEKNFFCQAVSHSLLPDGVIEDYECCDNPKFKFLYLVYFEDLTGGSRYIKPVNGTRIEIEPEEAQEDLRYLYSKAHEWGLAIMKTNYSSELLQQVGSEARLELKNLAEEPEFKNDPFAKGSNRFGYKKIAILLQFKWIYCIALEIYEATDPLDFIMELNGVSIEFTEYSLVHIMNRHFGAIVKQYQTRKTFHVEDIEPRKLGSQIKGFIKEMDNSQLLQGKPIDKIAFSFRNIDYMIWTAQRTKSIKGKGNILYRRVETFYAVSDPIEKGKLERDYILNVINDELSVYVA